MKNIIVILSILSILVTRNVSGQSSDFNCPGCCELSVNQNGGDNVIECVCPNQCTCSSPFNCDCPDDCKAQS